MKLRRDRQVARLWLAAVAAVGVSACGAPSTVVTPSGDAPGATPSPAQVELPYLPPVPEVRGTLVMPPDARLPVAQERTAAELGVLVDREPAQLVLDLLPCRFVPAEQAAGPSASDVPTTDCRQHNRDTYADRAHTAIVVAPGQYDITVRNHAFDRALGLWLRSSEQPGSAVVSAGGVELGEERTWRVTLTPGTYLYSCPLSPTPTYTIDVR